MRSTNVDIENGRRSLLWLGSSRRCVAKMAILPFRSRLVIEELIYSKNSIGALASLGSLTVVSGSPPEKSNTDVLLFPKSIYFWLYSFRFNLERANEISENIGSFVLNDKKKRERNCEEISYDSIYSRSVYFLELWKVARKREGYTNVVSLINEGVLIHRVAF